MAPNVALVYGSFFMGDSERDIKTIHKEFPQIDGLEVAEPVAGNQFDFDSLKDCKLLIICTSSQYGMPPPEFKDFAHHLLTAATKSPGCLSHLQHAVYGNGDETYFKTYMNMPRYMDILLEKAGSRRFYARGETGEPCAPMDTEKCRCLDWAPAMWAAAAEAVKSGADAPAVPWDGLWAKHKSEHHDKVTQWDLAKLEKKLGKPGKVPAMLSKL
jgi:sulfite reductase alpha subunit-like flavoprotein